MSAPLNPAEQDAKAAEKKSKKELMKEKFQKGCGDYMKKGFSKEEAEKLAKKDLKKAQKDEVAKALKEHMLKGMDPEEALHKAMDEHGYEDGDEDEGEDKDMPVESVKKALDDIAEILGQPAMNQPIVSKDKMDELVKSLDGSAKGQFEAVQGELFHTRKVLREYVDSNRALGKAVQAMGEELVKALTGLQFAQADSVKKSLDAETVPAHLSAPRAADAPRALETKVVPTPAEAADSVKVTAGDFIEKANAWIENNPRDPMVKSLGAAIGELCSPGGDLKAQVDQFGKTIGLV